jgi:hypothetical protein
MEEVEATMKKLQQLQFRREELDKQYAAQFNAHLFLLPLFMILKSRTCYTHHYMLMIVPGKGKEKLKRNKIIIIIIDGIDLNFVPIILIIIIIVTITIIVSKIIIVTITIIVIGTMIVLFLESLPEFIIVLTLKEK